MRALKLYGPNEKGSRSICASYSISHLIFKIINIKAQFFFSFSKFTFFFNVVKLAEMFAKDGMSFLASCQNLLPRPWVIDDLDAFKSKWTQKTWKKVILPTQKKKIQIDVLVFRLKNRG